MQHATAERHREFAPDTFTSFGALLLFLRRRARLRQRDLALAVGYSEAQIGRLENDQRLPDVPTVMAQFVSALELADAPALAERLIELARTARQEQPSTEATPALTTSTAPDEAPTVAPQCMFELPHQPTPFLGRALERATLGQLLRTSSQRCITLVGPGGVGKTRLALQAATEQATHFAHGVCVVALAGVPSVDLVAPMIAQALRLTAPGGSDVVDQIGAYLRPRHLLLLLDNFEHLVAGAELLAQLLAAAPKLWIVVTSRERLQIRPEVVLEVAGLPASPRTSMDADALLGNTAVALFWTTAQRVRPGIESTAHQLAIAARICRLVDGLPLAIELAAAWVHMLALDEIERELHHTLDLLETHGGDLPPRHRSLRATFDHSWQLLTQAEQVALRRLSVFRGSFTRDAAHAVLVADCGDTSTPGTPLATLRVLGALANKSMLQASGGPDGTRYSLHPLVQQYAAEHAAMQPAEARVVGAEHSHYYLGLLLQHADALHGSTQHLTLAALLAEDDQLRAALQWAIAEHDMQALRQVFPPLMAFFEARSATQEGLQVCQQLIGRLGAITLPQTHANTHRSLLALAQAYAGWFSFYLGRSDDALRYLQQAHDLAASGNDALALGDVLMFHGVVLAETGDPAGSQRLLLACLHAYAACRDPWRAARGLYRLAMVLHQTGAYVVATQLFAACLAQLRAVNDPRGIGLTLNRLGVLDALLGRPDAAQQRLEEGLLHCSAINDRQGMASALFHMGVVAQGRDDHAQARYCFGESLHIFAELNQRYSMADVLAQIGYSAALEHDMPAAIQAFDEAWQLVQGGSPLSTLLLIVVGRAALDLVTEQVERAVEVLTLALQHPSSERHICSRATHLLHRAEAHLTPYHFAAAQARGRVATLEAYLPGGV